MARSISFVVDDVIDTQIAITELDDGSLHFEIDVLGTGSIGDLQGLFFDLTDPDTNEPLDLSTLAVTGDDVTAFETGEAGVSNLGQGVNVNGAVVNELGKFDAGVRFGTSGISKDDIQSTSFTLSGESLSLGNLNLADLALRYTSVGEEGGNRNGSLKIAGSIGAVAVNDLMSVDENTAGSVNLLENDGGAGSLVDVEGGLTQSVMVDGLDLGTLTVLLHDDFDFLEPGEFAEVFFGYVAVDDGGAANDTSDVALGLITVFEGVRQTQTDTARFFFQTDDQSQFATGPANDTEIRDDLPFVGVEFDQSTSVELNTGFSLTGNALGQALDGIGDFAQAVADVGCDILDTFSAGLFGDCDVKLPRRIDVPSASLDLSVGGKVGLQPYFTASGGPLGATVPVDIAFSVPDSVVAGSGFTIGTELIGFGGDAAFSTETPDVTFGVDLVFQLNASGGVELDFGSNVLPIFFKPQTIDQTINLFEYGGDLDSTSSDLPMPPSPQNSDNPGQFRYGDSTLTLYDPVLDLNGGLGSPEGGDLVTLNATGETVLTDLKLDVDDLVSRFIHLPPLSFNQKIPIKLDVKGVGEDLNILTLDIGVDLIDVDIINRLSIVQDLTMSIEELPMMATFEDGTVIDGLFVGDDVIVGDGVVSDTNGNGKLDFTVDVDMGAVMENLTTLGFSTDLFLGILRGTAKVKSDFFSNFDITLFPPDRSNDPYDGFLYSETFTFFETDDFTTVNDTSDFAVEGWETNAATLDAYEGAIDFFV